VNRLGELPPIRNQGARGTCVAHAVLAMREHLEILAGNTRDLDLSEQFVYWWCKAHYGIPTADGTYLSTAMLCLAEVGAPRESLWPYVMAQKSDQGEGPPPPAAANSDRAFCITKTIEVNRIDITGIKTRLNERHVVAFAMPVFDSWYHSSANQRWGKLTLPLPGEQPDGGHAMALVGYQDDPEAPGGGYFLLRNSWAALVVRERSAARLRLHPPTRTSRALRKAPSAPNASRRPVSTCATIPTTPARARWRNRPGTARMCGCADRRTGYLRHRRRPPASPTTDHDVAQSNLGFLELAPAATGMIEFVVQGLPEILGEISFEIDRGDLPAGATLGALSLSPLGDQPGALAAGENRGLLETIVFGSVVGALIGQLTMLPGERRLASLAVTIPADAQPGAQYALSIAELHGGKPAGRLEVQVAVTSGN
jgi:hypothetical protein